MGFHFPRVSSMYKSNFELNQRSFVKVSLSHVLDICAFNLVTLHGDGVGNAKPRHTPPKGKTIAIDGDFGVCSLLKTSSMINCQFWFEEVLYLLFERVTHNLLLMVHLLI